MATGGFLSAAVVASCLGCRLFFLTRFRFLLLGASLSLPDDPKAEYSPKLRRSSPVSGDSRSLSLTLVGGGS